MTLKEGDPACPICRGTGWHGGWKEKTGEAVRLRCPCVNRIRDTKLTDQRDCEFCGNEHAIEDMTLMEDCWICPSCEAEWRSEFDACEHEWEPYTDTHGESGRVCKHCSGFVPKPQHAGGTR